MTQRENIKQVDTDVLIAGAGPVGLTTANILAHYGVDFRIIDKESGPTDQSRALWVQPRTIEYWAKIGLAEQAIDEGHTSTDIYPLVNGKKYGSVSFGGTGEDRTPYNFALILEQSKSERLLLRGLEDQGVGVEWETEILDLDETEDGATATVRHPDGSEGKISASWVVGTEGASSKIRDILGLTFEGKTYERGFFVADVDMEWPYGHEHIFPEFTNNAFLGYFPMPGGENHFRIVSTLTPKLKAQRDAGEEADLDDIREAMKTLSGIDLELTGSRWISVYTVQQRMANHFRSTGPGKVFIAGDAAHTHSPAGGQGMNTGIGDAFNLGWKLALVIKGEARPELLDSYEAERLPVARSILDKSDNLFNFEVTNKPLLDKLKVSVLPIIVALATRSEWANRQFFDFTAQIDINYDESPAVEQAQKAPRKGPKAGDRAPYGLFQDGADLYELMEGTRHDLLFFEGEKPDPDRLRATRKEIQNLLDRYEVSTNVHPVPAENEKLYERYGVEKPSLFLVRPDGHTAYVGNAADFIGLKMYFDRLFVRQDESKMEEAAT